jgi:hypothetical protein
LNLQQRFVDRFEQLRELMPADVEISEQRRLLIGSYFLAEYSLESAALFSPSMVPHPDQTNLPDGRGALRAEPARDRGRTYLLHHVSQRHCPSRSAH